MFAVISKARRLHLPIDIQIQHFYSIVIPILLHGSEVSEFESCNVLERLYIQFYKLIWKDEKSTPDIMLYGELGRYPISISTKARMIGFWQRIINCKTDKISYKLYKILLAMHQHGLFHSKWLLSFKNILHESDKEQVWSIQEAALNISKIVKLKLTEIYKRSWKESVFKSPKCLNYRIFKYTFGLEKYFGVLLDDFALAFFFILNH